MSTPELLGWLLSLLFGALAAVLTVLLTPEEDITADGGGEAWRKTPKRRSVLLKIFYPLIKALAELMTLLPVSGNLARREKLLIKAGHPGALTAAEFNATRIIAIVFAAAAGWFIDGETGLTPVITLLLTVVGFVYPDIWLNDAIAKRRRRIFRDLPDILDTLRLSVDAGFDLSSALAVVVERGRKGPLLDELELVSREVSLGRTRREAFKNFADRIAMAEINAFVLALNQADQLGASIGPVLKAQSDMARTRRWQVAETIVNKLPMKMLAPLVIFIFPSSFIILFTPLLIQWMQSK